MMLRFVTLLCAITLLVACGGQVGQPRAGLVPDVSSGPIADTGALVVRVRVPMHPDYVSAATKALTVQIAGPTKMNATVGLVLTAKGCKSSLMTLSCALTLPSLKACPTKKPCYKATVATFDAFNAASHKIPHGAHKLSADQSFSFTIAKGNTVVSLVLEGIPTTVAFLPDANSSLSGTQTAGFIEPKCTTSTQSVSVVGVDADGNYILGVGAPKVTLTSDDAAQLSVSHGGSSAPNTFTLVPPAAPGYAFGNHTVHLTAKATPGKKSGAKAASAVVNVAYSGNICGVITEFTIPTAGSDPHGVAAGPDGNVWFVEEFGNKVGRITPAGTITEFTIPTPSTRPFSIAAGPDGNLWFTQINTNQIGRMTTSGIVVETAVTTLSSSPESIAAGPDGNMWFTEVNGGNVAKISPTTSTINEFSTGAGSQPAGITAGPDGNLWFVLSSASQIGRVATSGAISAFPTTTHASNPSGVAAGADGAMWFVECSANKIGRISTGGVATSEFPLPEAASTPLRITRGPDGAVWFTEFSGNRIGGITLGGVITEYAVPTGASEPLDITVGPDGALWFDEFATNKIARLR